MPSLTPGIDLGLDFAVLQTQIVDSLRDLQAWHPSVSVPNDLIAGIPTWTIIPGVLTAFALMFFIAAIPWRASDLAPVATEYRHSYLVVALISTGVMLSFAMAQGFILLGASIGPVL